MARNRIDGTNDPETLNGTTGDDDIRGKRGDDTLNGFEGNDRLRGDKGDDILNGGDGRDRLRGDHGDDTLTGGADRDRFKFDLQGGHDTVTDYEDEVDVLDFTNFAIAPTDTQSAFEVLMAHAEQVGDDVVFTMDTGEMMTIQNTLITDFDAGDFRI